MKKKIIYIIISIVTIIILFFGVKYLFITRIDIDDIKVLSKMSGDITLEDVSTEKENKLNVKCGNKTVSIPKYDADSDIHMPDMSGSEELVLTAKENWLLETVVNLATFTSDNDSNKLMQMFNFNLIKQICSQRKRQRSVI